MMSGKKNRTFEEGREIVRSLKRSGLSQERFAKKLGISAAVVGYWVKRIRDLQKPQKKTEVKFVEVVTPAVKTRQETTVNLPGGICLKMSELPTPSYLAELSLEYKRRSLC